LKKEGRSFSPPLTKRDGASGDAAVWGIGVRLVRAQYFTLRNHPVTLRVPPLLEKEGRNFLPASHEAEWRQRRRGGVGYRSAAV
jgi:hypothetical protein